MRFDGLVLEISQGTFCMTMVHSNDISGQIILILLLDQISQRREMRLEQVHLVKFNAKLNELLFKS